MLKEFKEFATKGNIFDMAIGVIIGGSFQKIVTSLVNDILMPVIGVLLGGVDFSNLVLEVGKAKIAYGMFIQNIIDFLIIAICVFAFVKVINKLSSITKKEEDKKEEVKEEIKETELSVLKEIKAELKKFNKTTSKNKKD